MHDSTHLGPGTSTPLSCPCGAELLAQLRERVSPEQFNIWFRSIQAVRVDGSTVELELPNEHYTNWLEKRFSEQLTDAARSVLGLGANVVLKAPDGSPERLQRLKGTSDPTESKPSERLVRANSPYIRVCHHWLEELMPQLKPSEWCLYLLLMRFVWRGKTSFEPLRERIAKGEIVAYVSTNKLARIMGWSSRMVRKCIRGLEKGGLVQTTHFPGRASLYTLGHKGAEGEDWFAEQACSASVNRPRNV